jgi:predicted RNA binding protein YcfA (HicA-like mRNA interferase family)
MPRLPRVTAREAERAIMRDGWILSGGAGSHRQYTHPTKAGRVTISHHAGRILDPRTLTSILRQASLTADEFRALL